MAKNLTRSDLGGPALKAEKHLKEHCPRLLKSLKAEGEQAYLEYLVGVERDYLAMLDRLWKQGVDPYEAQSQATREFITIPDA